MPQQFQRREPLNEGVFMPTIDYNLGVWIAYQNCIQIQFMRHVEDFSHAVKLLTVMILPEWQDSRFKKETKEAHGQAIYYFQAITNLLHRRGFFEVKSKDLGHL